MVIAQVPSQRFCQAHQMEYLPDRKIFPFINSLNNLKSKRSTDDIGRERSHDLSTVWLNNSTKSRN